MSLVRKLAFTFITLILAFLFLEAAIRLTNYDQEWMKGLYFEGGVLPGIQMPDSYLLWRNKPRATYKWPPEQLNAGGYRGPLAAASKGKYVLRIAVLGDSCTFGIVGDANSGLQFPIPYPQLLQRLLDRNLPRSQFEVLSYGVIGYTSFQGLRLLKREVLKVDPDFVVIRFGWNDHFLSSYGRSFSSPKNALSEAVESLLYKSRLAAMLLFPRNPKYDLKALLPSPGEDPVVWVGLDDYAHNLERMIELARDHGAFPILIDAPAAPIGPELRAQKFFVQAAGYDSFESLVEAHTEYQEITERVAREKRVPFVKTAVAYVKGKSRPMFNPYDIAHPTQAGHVRIANWLFAEIAGRVMREGAAAN